MMMKAGRSYAILVWHQYKKNKPAFIAVCVLGWMLIIALLSPILATDRPLYLQYHGEHFFPAFSPSQTLVIKTDSGLLRIDADQVDWRKLNPEAIVFAPVPFAPGKGDILNYGFAGPFAPQKYYSNGKIVSMPLRYRHWLGTGSRGDDLLAGLIQGTRISLTIGLLAMLMASLLGMVIGITAGFFGDKGLRMSIGRLVMITAGIFLGWFYGFQLRSSSFLSVSSGLTAENIFQISISILIFAGAVFVFSLGGKILSGITFFNKVIFIPVDTIVSRMIEIFVSLPVLLLIIIIAGIATPSFSGVVIIIGFTSWAGIARLTRAEMLRVRQLEYIQAARALGYSRSRIMLRHALPNVIAPVLVSISFIVAHAILIESALSFLSIGVPQTVTTWGSLISEGRQNFSAWWMAVFPGASILITVLAWNLIGEGLRDALDPKMRR